MCNNAFVHYHKEKKKPLDYLQPQNYVCHKTNIHSTHIRAKVESHLLISIQSELELEFSLPYLGSSPDVI